MQANDLIIEVDDDHEEKSAQMLLAFICERFNGNKVSNEVINRMLIEVGAAEMKDSEIAVCISRAVLYCNDSDVQDRMGFYIDDEDGEFSI